MTSFFNPPPYFRWAVLILLLCVVAPLSYAQAARSTNGSEATNATASQHAGDFDREEYLISPDDVLDIYILDVPELSRTYRVGPSGLVTLPLLDKPLRASGLTLTAFSELVKEQLSTSGLVTTPRVTVSVQQSRLHAVAITGAVKHPQIYTVLGRTTLLDVLSQAEGLADDAGNVALVRRGEIAISVLGLDTSVSMTSQEREALLTIAVDTKRLMESSEPGVNVDIFPGDRVTVPRAGIVYVVGAVNRPGGFTMKPGKQGMTVLQAIALAEDLKSTAISGKTMLLRADPQSADGRKQIPIDLKKVLAGQAQDTLLQAEDILFVPDSPGKKAFRRGLEAALQTVTGLAIYRR